MVQARSRRISITGDQQADDLLERDAFALLAGMMLDQQFPMERAFAGPATISRRLGVDRLDPATIASYDPEKFASLCATPPAVHRYPASMAARMQALAQVVVDDYDGDTAAIWTDVRTTSSLGGSRRSLTSKMSAKSESICTINRVSIISDPNPLIVRSSCNAPDTRRRSFKNNDPAANSPR